MVSCYYSPPVSSLLRLCVCVCVHVAMLPASLLFSVSMALGSGLNEYLWQLIVVLSC